MAIKNTGNFKKTIGIYEMKLPNGTIIDFKEGYDGEELIDFSYALKNNEDVKGLANFVLGNLIKNDAFKPDGCLHVEEATCDCENKWVDADKSRFVVENLSHLIKGYMIMMNMTDEKTFDEQLDKQIGEDKSPIVSAPKVQPKTD